MILSQSVRRAKEYFNEALRKTDYYLNDQELSGHIQGKVAARLCITGKTSKDVFHALCENIHPLTGERLTPRTKSIRRIGYDINFHCPKSVSILHALAQDAHILDAFTQSVSETMFNIERDVQTRIRKSGVIGKANENRCTGELVWADFVHQTARPVGLADPDPHLHCHCFTFNVTWDNVEKKFKAGQFHDIKRDMPFYQAQFHKILSDKLIALGYHIKRTDKSFEVENIPRAVIDLFSKRTSEIGLIAREQNITDQKELDALGSLTRSQKSKGKPMTELKSQWRKQIRKLDKVIDENTPVRFANHLESNGISAKNCIDYALDLRLERASVVHERRILESALRHAISFSQVSFQEIIETYSKDRRILKVKDGSKTLCTTKDVLAEERLMVSLANAGRGKLKPLYNILPSIKLSGEQLEAINHVLTTTNRVSIIQGRAGTGKTTLMKETIKLIEQMGKEVTVVAPTAQASRGVLRNEGFNSAETVTKLLTTPDLHAVLRNGVLWVDEAGLLGTKDMCSLLALAQNQNARLILSGDTRQHSSVVRGDALRILNTVAGIKSANVSRIYRQRAEDYREAVQAFSEGNIVEGFHKLLEMGALKQINAKSNYKTLVMDYMEVVGKGRSALVIAPTHKEGDKVTSEIRQMLRQCGRIGVTDILVPMLTNTNMTLAEKSDARNYRKGLKIQFNQNLQGIARGSVWTVVSNNITNIEIETQTGAKAILQLDRSNAFDVFYQSCLPLSENDTIQITRNLYDLQKRRLDNGTVLKFLSIDKNGNLRFCNSVSKIEYLLPKDFGHLTHGYCITSHSSQGKTVDEVFIAQPSSTFPATSLKQFYVSVSRGRDKATIYTDDLQGLFNHASDDADRRSAIEALGAKSVSVKAAEHLARLNQPKIILRNHEILNFQSFHIGDDNDIKPQL